MSVQVKRAVDRTSHRRGARRPRRTGDRGRRPARRRRRPCPSSRATARRSRAASTTRSCARSRSASATCASSRTRRAAVLAVRRGAGQARRRAAGADPRRRDQGAPRGHLPARSSRSAAPRRRSPARPVSSRSPTLLLGDPGHRPGARRSAFVDADREVADAAAALDGARAILVERFAEDADLIGDLRERVWKQGHVGSRVRSGKEEEGAKFSDYFDFAEPLAKLPSHRILALFRGEKEDVLALDDRPRGPSGRAAARPDGIRTRHRRAASASRTPGARPTSGSPTPSAGPGARRSSSTSASTLRMQLRRAAEEEAVRVFAANLRDLLLAAPAGARATMGLDPGFRTGVKVAVVDGTGKRRRDRRSSTRTSRSNQWDRSLATLARLAKEHSVDLIAIGNGTASRETDRLAADLIKRHPELKLTPAVVSEAGASVYSASAFASQELPGMDVSLRGAVSIARRLQDPLAELVKIDPKSIGVGQYQHDISQTALSRSLDAVVEDCVNAVGVDVNTASAPLLTRVSGITPGLAESIVAHRDATGPFRTRKALKDVPRLGPKAFEQAAGFLRIPGGDDPLDASAVHPEAYPVVRRMLESTGQKLTSLIGNTAALQAIRPADYVDDTLRPADRHRHHQRARQARARPATDVQDGDLQGGRRGDQAPQAGHDARGRRDQRRGLRCVHRRRRPPGRPGPRLGAVEELRARPARGRQARRRRHGQGPRRRRAPQADLADPAPRRRGDPGLPEGADRPGPGRPAARRPEPCWPGPWRPGPWWPGRAVGQGRGGQGSGARAAGPADEPPANSAMADALRRAGFTG